MNNPMQIEMRPPTDAAHELSLDLMHFFDWRDTDPVVAQEAMLWTICLSAGLNAGALTFPPLDPETPKGREEYLRTLTFFTSLRLLAAGIIEQF